MPSDQTIAEFAIQEALKELRLGKKQAARSWALKALSTSPNLEEPWLIMGELASPEGSLHFYQEALKINPGSQRAQNGLNEAQRRARKTGQNLNFNIPQRKTEVSLQAEPAMIAPVAEAVPVSVPTPLPMEKKRR
jgi:type II secretory pathway component HofQ